MCTYVSLYIDIYIYLGYIYIHINIYIYICIVLNLACREALCAWMVIDNFVARSVRMGIWVRRQNILKVERDLKDFISVFQWL